eukprot:CAMPEP_0172621722 /NCGR_PEP_ID=MMETSP1068-20121228/114688_1 /TAXON_ID=35684 /ORGANISM="Pseudopedinella elastica, Strain CCMP716" /LENGTH=86 /DNA_ID=CAMNT_0013429593 /DNA_START=72 /DNA_END=328 /DNA_ORIENTATION=+
MSYLLVANGVVIFAVAIRFRPSILRSLGVTLSDEPDGSEDAADEWDTEGGQATSSGTSGAAWPAGVRRRGGGSDAGAEMAGTSGWA